MTSSDVGSGLEFVHYNFIDARHMRATVEGIYVDSYVDAIASGDPFDSVESFMMRFDAYVRRDGIDLVIAYKDGEPIGQTWGWPLDAQAGKAWWAGLQEIPEPGFTEEDGNRTFALSEIMVRQQFSGQHYARQLHDELLSVRIERRATLLVEAENARAYRAYKGWGWQRVGQLRPGWQHAPVLDVLVLDLPLASPDGGRVTHGEVSG